MNRLWMALVCCVVVSGAAFAEADRKEAPREKVTASGKLTTGLAAGGGETTGVMLSCKDNKFWELELSAELLKKAEPLNGKEVAVEGEAYIKPGIEVKRDRHIIKVSKLEAVAVESVKKDKKDDKPDDEKINGRR
jgi:hypothetical protein